MAPAVQHVQRASRGTHRGTGTVEGYAGHPDDSTFGSLTSGHPLSSDLGHTLPTSPPVVTTTDGRGVREGVAVTATGQAPPAGSAEFDRELTLAALTGWSALSPGQVRRLAALAEATGQLDRLLTTPGMLAGVAATVLLPVLTGLGPAARAWGHLLAAAGLPSADLSPGAHGGRLRLVAAGVPDLPPAAHVAVDRLAGPPGPTALVVEWATVPGVVFVPLPDLAGPLAGATTVVTVPSPDGRVLLATGDDGGQLHVYDPATGVEVRAFPSGHDGELDALAPVPASDGRTLLATAADDVVRVWDPTDGRLVTEVPADHGGGALVAGVPLPDGRTLLAVAAEDVVGLWDPATGRRVGTLTGHGDEVTALAALALPDGRSLLATGGDDTTVRLWDPGTGEPVGDPFTGLTDAVDSLAAVPLPDGRVLLAVGDDDTVRLWDVATGASAGSFPVPDVTAVTAVTHPDRPALLVTVGDGSRVRSWDPSTCLPVGAPPDDLDLYVSAMATARLPDGRVLLVSVGDGEVRVHDLVDGGGTTDGHGNRLMWVAPLTGPDRRLLLASASSDRTARLWDVAARRPVGPPMWHAEEVNTVVPVSLPDGRTLLATGTDENTVHLWDPVTGLAVGEPLRGHEDRVWAVTVVPLPDGRVLVASGGGDDTVRLWDPVTGRSVGEPLAGHTDEVNVVAAVPLPDGRVLLASGGDDAGVRLWDPVTGDGVGEPLTGHTGALWGIVPLPPVDGRPRLATAGSDHTVRLWDVLAGEPVGGPMTGHTASIWSMDRVTTADGRVLLVTGGNDHTVRLWDAGTGGELCHVAVPGPVYSVRGLPDGRIAVAHGSQLAVLRLVDAPAG